MHKIYTLLLASFLIGSSVAYASNIVDSIGVENYNGKKLIIYKVEAKETYYSISRKYNVNPKDVMTYNDNKFLQIGVTIKVPTAISFVSVTMPIATPTDAIISYTVIAKDNLNMIAEKYGTTVNEIKKINGLNSINLQIGQVLKVPTGKKDIVQVATIVTTPTPQPTTKTIAPLENIATNDYTIKAKDNLNLIAEKYETTVEILKKLNGLSSNNLSIGQVLKVPTTSENIVEQQVEKVVMQPIPKAIIQKPVPVQVPVKNVLSDGSFEYTVATGETIYSIAKKFNLTTYQLKTANNLTANEVNVGQKLVIKENKSVAENNTEVNESTTSTNTIKDPTLKYPASKYGITKVEEKGTAVWISDQDLDPSKMLVLHRTAPVGTIVNITNPMTNRTTFAKVVGKFTENESTKDVIIVITKAVADAIGALDKRFFCNINYGTQENEQR